MKTVLKCLLRTDISVFHGLLFHKTMNRDGSESAQWIAENRAVGLGLVFFQGEGCDGVLLCS